MTLVLLGIICLFVLVLAACRGRRTHPNIEPLTPGIGMREGNVDPDSVPLFKPEWNSKR